MKNLNELLYERVFSPIWITPESEPPVFTTSWAKIGSKEASSYFWTFSRRTHFPYWTANSKVLMIDSPILTTSMPSGCYLAIFLINLFAWFWGSIIKGHLLVLSIMIPFSVEVSSFGSYAIFQAWILTGSPRKPLMLFPSVWGRPLYLSLFCHYFSIFYLNPLVKAPA